ncbi:MAG: primosomal protein N' [Bacteroidetes bacterium]|nr:primosomal protein N' [Bacteroidota bacterium]MCL5737520.1 primosomal protein N' [Bacteroidota bacterium]
MKKRFCDVAFPISVHRQFTYEIPSELSDAVKVGVRVVAPFRKRFLTGVVVNLTNESNLREIRSIQDVADDTQIFSDEILRLTRWISDYYLSSWGEALKVAGPAGTSIESTQVVKLLGEDGKEKNQTRIKIIEALKLNRELTMKQLSKKVGSKGLRYHIGKLQAAGVVEAAEKINEPRVSIKYESYVQFKDEYINPEKLTEVLRELDKRATKQSEILLKLTQLSKVSEGGVSVVQLLAQARASMSSLLALAEKGIVELYDKESYREAEFGYREAERKFDLTSQQTETVKKIGDALSAGTYSTFLLHGVTGSGKTQVYIESIDIVLKQGKSAIVLVPEIALTPQIVDRFKRRFGEAVAVMHSRMSLGERYDAWRRIHRGEASVVIGARSAVFAPMKNLGIIVVDEEHESSYKQADSVPRYNARDVAVMRCSINKAVALLGSATPSVESYYNAANGKYTLLSLPDRIDNARMPKIEIIDMKKKRKEKLVFGSFSDELRSRIDDRLAKKEGIIILRNRRGFSTYLQCSDCGMTEMCPNCDVALTFHKRKKHLRCHYCGFVKEPPVRCPKCGSEKLFYGGTGTQKVEEELNANFPEAKILRMDLDTTSLRGAHDKILMEFGNGEADMLVGTQLVAKGLDFPRVTLVGVVSADSTMLMPDFRSNERTFQLLTQVSGRAGRREKEGEVIIQVSNSSDDVLLFVANHDYQGFYNKEIEVRRELNYPPFSRMVVLEFRGRDLRDTDQAAEKAARKIRKSLPVIAVLGPAPAIIGRLLGKFRYQIVIKMSKQLDKASERLEAVLDEIDLELKRSYGNTVSFFPDVDPVTTL